jgi:hypothetical protein
MNSSLSADLKISFKIVWIIVSIFLLAVLTMSFLFPEILLKISPVCVSKSLYDVECFICGTTRAFIEISSFNFSGAYELNKFSIILFSIFMLNTLMFLIFLFSFIRKIISKE